MRPRDRKQGDRFLSDLRRRLTDRAKWLSSPDPDEAFDIVLFRAYNNEKVAAALDHILDDSLTDVAEPDWLNFWLFSTLQYVVMEQIRSRRVLVSIESDDSERKTADPFIAGGAGPEEQVFRRQCQQALAHCLQGLPEKQQRAVMLSFHGFKQREIALDLGTNENNVASLIKRGKEKLCGCLRQRLLRTPPSEGAENHDV